MFDSARYRNDVNFDDREAYFSREVRIKQEMREDLEEEFGISGNVYADAIWSLACAGTYSDDPYDIYDAYEAEVEIHGQ